MVSAQEKEIAAYKAELRDEKYKAGVLPKILQARLDVIKKYKPSDTIDTRNLLHTLDVALRHPNLVDVSLLSTYMTELIRIMVNLGEGLDFAIYLDKGIQYYKSLGLSTVDLHLAKATYLGLLSIENPKRKEAIDAAMDCAQTPEDKIKCQVALAHYFNDSSQYQLSIETCQKCQELMDEHQNLKKYHADILIILGMNYFYLFDYPNAETYFQEALNAVDIQDGVVPKGTSLGAFGVSINVQTSLHYLGRICATRGSLSGALDYYVKGLLHSYKYEPEELGEIAFTHLRIGELLTSVDLIHQAHDHLSESQRLFAFMQNTSSPQVQIDLAFADIYIKENNDQKAEQTIRNAIYFSKSKGFPRGELLGFEKLFGFNLGGFVSIRLFTPYTKR